MNTSHKGVNAAGGGIDYMSNAGRHRHKLCNHCTECGEPLLATYCPEHQPSWGFYWLSRIYKLAFKIKARFMNWEEL